ncbi:MAG: P-loop NTPase fold protein [Clostridium chrysemydis]|uniref:P-loop NTPase fold protein n=1 Tax=Clostridium chrysemydis TaxID=2665504 RepID=UPI003F3E2AA8
MEKVLKDNEILRIIDDYVENNDIGGAILIDGKWGCGKTYFIEKKVIPRLNENDKKYIYISLYGIASILDIERELLRKTIPFLKSEKKVPSFIRGVLDDVLIKGIELKTGVDIKDTLTEVMSNFSDSKDDYTKYVIIFDDLERCDIKLNIILGYINQLVEHEEQKVIIVSNEEELNKDNYNENKELKYISVYQMYKNINSKQEIISKRTEYNLVDREICEIGDEGKEKLDRLVQNLYYNNDYYDEIKEKLIYQTVKYNPDKKQIIENIVNDYELKGNTDKLIRRNINYIIEIFDNKKYFNGRTIRHLIGKLESILGVINEEDLEEYEASKVIKNIIQSTASIVIDMKKDNKDYSQIISEDEIISIDLSKNIFASAYTVKSILEFLVYSYMDEQQLNKEIDKLNRLIKKSDEIIPYEWYIKSDKEIKKNFERIKRRIEEKDKTIDISILKSKIGYFYMLYKLEIIKKKELDDLVTSIGEMIESREGYDSHNSTERSKYENEEEYKQMLKELNSFSYKSFYEITKEDTKDFFQKKDMDGVFKYLIDNKDKFIFKKGFLKYFDIENIVEIYFYGNNEQRYNLNYAINSIYNMANLDDFFIDDIENIEKLREELKKKLMDENQSDTLDGIGKWNTENLIEILDEKLKILKNYNL